MQSSEKTTKFGIISSILAILISVFWCTYIVILMIYTQRDVTTIDLTSAFVAVLLVYGGLLVMAMLTFLVTITGMVLSVLSLRKGEPKRFFAIVGFVINFLWLLPYCIGCFTFFLPLDS